MSWRGGLSPRRSADNVGGAPRRVARHALLGAVTTLLAGCSSSPTRPRVCTAIYAYLTATPIDAQGAPVYGLAVRDSVPRTGTAFDEPQLTLFDTSRVVIFSDGDQGKVSTTHTEPVIVSGSGTAGTFTADYVFDATGCHVEKVSGPDTVVVR
jgi:hypothetical protein